MKNSDNKDIAQRAINTVNNWPEWKRDYKLTRFCTSPTLVKDSPGLREDLRKEKK